MSEQQPASSSEQEEWFDVVKRTDDWLTISIPGSNTEISVPTWTGIDFIDNPPEIPESQ